MTKARTQYTGATESIYVYLLYSELRSEYSVLASVSRYSVRSANEALS